MDTIHLENYRCFHHRQVARMAPLTLLVGGNSTGKTSFLALIRALWDIVLDSRLPDFKEEPYDLGSFDEIAHHRGAKGGRSNTFEAGFSVGSSNPKSFCFAFGKSGSTPVPIMRCVEQGKIWMKEEFSVNGRTHVIQVGTDKGSWMKQEYDDHSKFTAAERLVPLNFLVPRVSPIGFQDSFLYFHPVNGSPEIEHLDVEKLRRLTAQRRSTRRRTFASAPVRSKPQRTYDPSRLLPDPEGDYIPMFLAEIFRHHKETWTDLKALLEEFGKASGLFDEITIKLLGGRSSEPFQIQVRKFGGKLKGPPRNLSDVGYGVSQALPVITELLRKDNEVSAPTLFLLQQPEVHLHPRAQASLGSLFCQVATPDRQLVVETHSDYLIDRVRMDIRDRKTRLQPEDVSILFFEQNALEVKIHSLRIDSEGNISNSPAGYRSFFMEETQRSLGI